MHRLGIRFAKEEELKYISHLDLLRTYVRAIRRSRLPISYSQGFKPRPKITLAVPLPLGATSSGEYCDILLQEKVSPEFFGKKLAQQLPPGLRLMKVFDVLLEAPPLPAVIQGALYSYRNPHGLPGDIQEKANKLLQRKEIKVARNKGRGKVIEVDIRPFIYSLKVNCQESKTQASLEMLLATGSKGGAKPSEILKNLGEDNVESYLLHRHSLYLRKDGMFKEPEEIITP